MTMELSQAEFNEGLRLLIVNDRKTARDIVKITTRFTIPKLIALTPEITDKTIEKMKQIMPWRVKWAEKNQSTAKTGWLPGFEAVGGRSRPSMRNKRAKKFGTFKSGLNRSADPFFEIVNEVEYAVILDERKKIVSRALQWQLRFMRRRLESAYGILLKRHSA